MTDNIGELSDRVLEGDSTALPRLISIIEDRRDGYETAIKKLHSRSNNCQIVGVTGSPGSGKSTLVNRLLEHYDESDVGVIAVDPNSPYSGGAVLGDRIRFQERSGSRDVFFRSMSTRGSLGGLAAATNDVIRVLDAYGMDLVIVETVGAGQNEIEIVETADTVVVLVIPTTGDDIQMLKAGILEIGDVFVVNKGDLSGADRTVMEVREMIDRSERFSGDSNWNRRVVRTIATDGDNIEELKESLDEHWNYLLGSGEGHQRKVNRCASELRAILEDRMRQNAEEAIDKVGGMRNLAERIADGETDPYTMADELLG